MILTCFEEFNHGATISSGISQNTVKIGATLKYAPATTNPVNTLGKIPPSVTKKITKQTQGFWHTKKQANNQATQRKQNQQRVKKNKNKNKPAIRLDVTITCV